MEAETVKWAKVICPMVVNTVVKVREKGFIAMKLGLPIMLKNKQHLDAISKHLMDDLKVVSVNGLLFLAVAVAAFVRTLPLFPATQSGKL